ncbi:elongation factor Ts [Thiothrix litoralis]|jgi:elongation factor Ts|uniref:Elongation factor Ts n=2 Tax=Thiothrix TaxID=1030 RepID=A0ABY9MQH4_9GAMM|nr:MULTISPECIES: translation elongation factor Ts [Thiothrix]QTR44490.1 elongation factor Ts [Thiothrix litoralis]WML90076.1 translation elongation factor Ts [Thiothrix lacustris]WMP18318.1 translation elongation factor Ts [Thiothrix lacustris]
MAITAGMVKELRERTGAGMMECKKALTETNGDMEAAIDLMRKSGAAKADKKAGRVAAEGRVVIALTADAKRAVVVEVNSETDFAAKDSFFVAFAEEVGATALANNVADVEALSAMTEASRTALIAKIGENVQVRRLVWVDAGAGQLSTYQHGAKIGVVVSMTGGDDEMGKHIAMHIAASRPACVDESGVPADLVEREREIQIDIAMQSGKPRDIAEKMVVGRMKKFLGEITLVGQPFVMNPDQTVGDLLTSKGASIAEFVRLEVGEGIEKKQDNFAEEVAAQAAAAAAGN